MKFSSEFQCLELAKNVNGFKLSFTDSLKYDLKLLKILFECSTDVFNAEKYKNIRKKNNYIWINI